jgi:hypothetical protein
MRQMSTPMEPVLVASLAGIAGGLGLLARGLGSYRLANRISDTAGSPVASVAAGEVRISGTVEPAELLLVSPLQSAPCVYYRASVRQAEGRANETVFNEERAVGFRLRDTTGVIRVFPRGGRWAIPDRFAATTGMLGDQPAGLAIRFGPALHAGGQDPVAAGEELLTVHDPHAGASTLLPLLGSGHRSYHEARIEPGDMITVVGFAEPFDQLPDPSAADDATFGDVVTDSTADPAIAADMAAARAAGELALTPDEAWGNAAIEGFGIGRPVRPPHLDPASNPLPLADPEMAQRIERTFAIPPEALILVATDDVPLLITIGAPGEAAARADRQFLVGLVGAVVAIASAAVLGLLLSGSVI